jgi:hypothetical protein
MNVIVVSNLHGAKAKCDIAAMQLLPKYSKFDCHWCSIIRFLSTFAVKGLDETSKPLLFQLVCSTLDKFAFHGAHRQAPNWWDNAVRFDFLSRIPSLLDVVDAFGSTNSAFSNAKGIKVSIQRPMTNICLLIFCVQSTQSLVICCCSDISRGDCDKI